LKKILHIISGLNNGGAERSLFNLCNSNLNQHFEQIVLCLGKQGIYGPKLEEIGIKVCYIEFKSGNKIFRLINFFKICKEINPEILQGWMTHGNFFALIAYFYLNFKPKLYWNIRQTFNYLKNEKLVNYFLFNINLLFSRIPHLIICNSTLAIKQLIEKGYPKNSMYLINNGFDITNWSRNEIIRENFRNTLKLTQSDLVVGYIGNFHKNKNVRLLIKVISELSIDYPSLYAILIGKGLDENNLFLKDHLKKFHIKNLILLGSINDVKDYYSIFDCFCLTSNSEAFPNVLGEAMGHGLYCIASDVGDVPLILDDVGAIFTRDDDNDLKERLIYWINHNEKLKLLGEKARLRIKEKYSLENTINSYTKLYNN